MAKKISNTYPVIKEAKKHRLTEDEKDIVIELLANRHANSTAAKKFQMLTRKRISRVGIQYYRATYADRIKERKAEIAASSEEGFEAVILADRVARVVMLQELADEAMEREDIAEVRKVLHEIMIQVGDSSPDIVVANLIQVGQNEGQAAVANIMEKFSAALGPEAYAKLVDKMDDEAIGLIEEDAGKRRNVNK